MTALLNWRVMAALLLLMGLSASHWKAYVMGKHTIQTEWAAETLMLTEAAADASEANRVKEKALNLSVERVRHDLAKTKTAAAADARVSAERLRDLNAALDRATPTDPAAPSGVDADPRPLIIAGCARALVRMDEVVKDLAGTTIALQRYTREVCLSGQ